ncbi:MAG: CbiX/SirB N-terminal domain-containing protein, partial [Nodosilinea sp.]
YQPQRIIVLPYFLFTGVLVKKIMEITRQQQVAYPELVITALPEMGDHPQLLEMLRDRELETHLGQVQMNCEMCKFRLAARDPGASHNHHHDHSHGHHHHHGQPQDLFPTPESYHQRAWQVP